MNRRSTYRLRLRAQAEVARAASLAHVVELKRAEEQQQLAEASRNRAVTSRCSKHSSRIFSLEQQAHP